MLDGIFPDFDLQVTLLYTSILTLIFVMLSFLVVRARFREGVSLGTGDKPGMEKPMRAHGNFAEYVPLALILMGLLELSGHDDGFLHAYGAVLVLARISHAWGIHIRKAPNAFRAGGMMATMAVLLVGAVAGLIAALG